MGETGRLRERVKWYVGLPIGKGYSSRGYGRISGCLSGRFSDWSKNRWLV